MTYELKMHLLAGEPDARGGTRTLCGRPIWKREGRRDEYADRFGRRFDATAEIKAVTCETCRAEASAHT